MRAWYDGTPLDVPQERRDRRSGRKVKRFPLELNLPKLACRVHRNVTRGMPESDAPLVVRTAIQAPGSAPSEEERAAAKRLERMVNHVWRSSYGGPLQQEALLDMNIYGGCVFQLKWLPWENMLPWRMAVRKVTPDNILPVWSQFDPWRPTSCYIGFKISKREARERYGVAVEDTAMDNVLYLEYWSRNEWWVRVNGQTPTMSWGDQSWPLKGQNPFGFVPIYYIPHTRSTKLWGDSQVEGQRAITREFNSRAANISDMVHATRPGVLWGHDLGRGNLTMRVIERDGRVVAHVVDVGDTRNLQGAQSPELDSLPIPDIPDTLADFPNQLLRWWMMTNDLAPAVFGDDDTQSGRITGPATAQRMFLSLGHCATERGYFTTGKTLVDQDIVRMAQKRQEYLEGIGRDVEDSIDPAMMTITQKWPEMIPLDKQQFFSNLIDELREGGISIERYLRERGVDNIQEEREKLLAWMEDIAEIESRQPVLEDSSADTADDQRG